eukprot:scaffold80544_cov61-Phaeocystis_antarctica.AAC.4
MPAQFPIQGASSGRDDALERGPAFAAAHPTHDLVDMHHAFTPAGLSGLLPLDGARPGRRNLPHRRDHLDGGLR